MEGLNVHFYSFLTSTLDDSEWLTWRLARWGQSRRFWGEKNFFGPTAIRTPNLSSCTQSVHRLPIPAHVCSSLRTACCDHSWQICHKKLLYCHVPNLRIECHIVEHSVAVAERYEERTVATSFVKQLVTFGSKGKGKGSAYSRPLRPRGWVEV